MLLNGPVVFTCGARAFAVDAASGVIQWEYPLAAEWTASLVVDAADSVYFGTPSTLYALDSA